MRAVGIQRGAITPQTIGHAETSGVKPLKAGLLHRLQRAERPGFTHHRWKPQQPGIKVSAELIRHHHRRSALSIDPVVLAVPEQVVEVGAGLLQPGSETSLFRCSIEAEIELQPLSHRQRRLQRRDPERAAVGTHTLQGPVVEGLIRGATVIRQAVVVDVEALEVIKGLYRRWPALSQEAEVLTGGGEAEGAPDLEHVITGQILPEIAVLISGVVRGIERAFVGSSQVVRGRTRHLAVGFHPTTALGEVPADWPLAGIGGRNGTGKTAQHRLVQLRPELQQGQ